MINLRKSAVLGAAMIATLAVAQTSCTPPPQYFHVSVGPLSPPTGTNCGGQNDLSSWSGVSLSQQWAVYPAPSNQFLLDGAQPSEIMNGTLKGGVYSFTGTTTNDDTSGGTDHGVTNTITYSVTMTTQGSGFTGTISIQQSCQSESGTDCTCLTATDPSCLSANGQNFNATNGMNFSCSEEATIAGTLLSNATPQNAITD